MGKNKSQRFVESDIKASNTVKRKRKLTPIYILTGIMILLLSLIPIMGAVLLIVWGAQIADNALWMAIILIIVGSALIISLITGTVIFALYYFTNDSAKKLQEIRYKDKMKFEDVFIKCEKCGATMLIDSTLCSNCGNKIETDEEKEKQANKLKEYFLDQYNFEISEKNIDIVNSYFNSNLKTFEYSHDKIKEENSNTSREHQIKESVLNKFLFNFKQIIVVCSIAIACLFIAFIIFGKYVIGF